MRGVVAASEEDGAVGAREVRRVETRREDERDEEDRRAEGPGAGHCRRLSRIERARRSDAGADTSTTTEQERPLAVGAKGTFVNAAGLATHPRARHGRAQRRITHRAARACVSIAHPPADNRTLRPAVASRRQGVRPNLASPTCPRRRARGDARAGARNWSGWHPSSTTAAATNRRAWHPTASNRGAERRLPNPRYPASAPTTRDPPPPFAARRLPRVARRRRRWTSDPRDGRPRVPIPGGIEPTRSRR